MLRSITVKRSVKWNSDLHPRNKDGTFAKKTMQPGEIPTADKFGEQGTRILTPYHNDPALLNAANPLLKMAAKGKVFSHSGADSALTRIHMMSDEDGNMMSVAGSDYNTCIVIDHNRDGFDDPHSLSRGNMYQPQPQNLAEGETTWGGRAAASSGRKDGKTYNVLQAHAAADNITTAFDGPNATSFTVNPGDLADRVADVRKAYMGLGYSRHQAENMAVYIYADGKGQVQVKPAYRVRDDGTLVPAHAPNTHGGTGTVKLPCTEVTRITRAMQDSHIDKVDMAVTQGTTGRTNALQFRAEYVNPADHHSITVMEQIEQHTQGHSVEQARSAVSNPDGTMNFAKRRELERKRYERHQREADPYRHPKTAKDAATFYRKLHGKIVDAPGTPEILEGDRFTFRSGSGYDPVFSGETGRQVGVHISSPEGAAFHAMSLRHGQPMPTPEQVSVRKGKARKTKKDIPAVYTVRWYDGHVDRFTADGEPYTSDAMFG